MARKKKNEVKEVEVSEVEEVTEEAPVEVIPETIEEVIEETVEEPVKEELASTPIVVGDKVILEVSQLSQYAGLEGSVDKAVGEGAFLVTTKIGRVLVKPENLKKI